jgi:hypothetical protein
VTSRGRFTPMIIEQCMWLLEMTLIRLRDRHIPRRKLCSQFCQWN